MSIAGNIEKIEERIQRACQVSGRKREDVSLMCVSKFQPLPAIEEAWNAGIRLFGESRVQEGVEKFSAFREGHPQAELHLIGPLQRNKAKAAAAFFDCVQSLDRPTLAVELGKQAGSKPLDVLFELHTGEETKGGFPDLDSLCKAAELALGFHSLCIKGLMTMAPFTSEKEPVRASFRLLREAREHLERRFPPGPDCSWSCLSMGMSGDFEIAIEEGATLLRIGSAIFGSVNEG
jgi:pyridoxal phosphate enzyme (YggS family)